MKKENKKAKSKKNFAAGAFLLCILVLCGLLVWRQAQQPAVIAQSEAASSSASETPASSACSENGIISSSETAESVVSTATTDAPKGDDAVKPGLKQYDPDGDGNYDVPCDDGTVLHFKDGKEYSCTMPMADGSLADVPCGTYWDALSDAEKVEWSRRCVGDAYGRQENTELNGDLTGFQL